jgi:hypothetical protein
MVDPHAGYNGVDFLYGGIFFVSSCIVLLKAFFFLEQISTMKYPWQGWCGWTNLPAGRKIF